jgi:perosamine synthetase
MPDSNHRNEVLMPAYNCGVEIETIISAGFTPSFFPVGPFCRVDPADIRRSINRHTAAVMLTHFNGFPQPAKEVKRMCSEEGITFIEDCAHVLQTTSNEGPVGSFGDFAAFSLKKFLPIPDGGLLAINTSFDHETALRQLPAKEVALSTVKCALDILRARHILRRNAGVTKAKQPEDGAIHDYASRYDFGISAVSRTLIDLFNIDEIVSRRRQHYRFLESAASDLCSIRPLMGPLVGEVCPMLFLAETPDPWALQHFMGSQGVEIFVFWSFFHRFYPFGKFPDSELRKVRVVGIPVHQGLSDDDLRFIALLLRKYAVSASWKM